MATISVASSCNVDSLTWASGDTLNINDGAVVTVNTDQSKFWKTININNGKLVIENSSTTTGMRFLMGRIVAATNWNVVTVYGLGAAEVTGNWIELGVGDGTAGQTFNFWGTNFCSHVWVETSPGSGEYELWSNVTWNANSYYFGSSSNMMLSSGAGKAGHHFVQGQVAEPYALTDTFASHFTSVLTFGDGVHGAVVPDGCKVRVPNIMLAEGTQLQIYNPGYYSQFDLTYSGQVTVNCCLFDMFRIDGTAAKLLSLTDVGMNVRPNITRCKLTVLRFGLVETSDRVYYASGVRAVASYWFASGNYIWSYLNGATITDFYRTIKAPQNYYTGNAYAMLMFQYCNDITVDGIYCDALGMLWTQPVLAVDFVNYSTFRNMRLLGGGWYFQNCNSSVFDSLEYMWSLLKKAYCATSTSGSGSYFSAFAYDKNGNPFADDTSYWLKLGLQRDNSFLYPLLDAGYDFNVVPFTPSDPSFPYYFGVTPGDNRNTIYWSATILPQHNAPAYQIFRGTSPGFTRDEGSRIFTTNTTTTTSHADTTAVNGTTYYYVFRKYKAAGEYVDSPEYMATPRAQKYINNRCLQSEDFSSSTWVKTGCTVTTNQMHSPTGSSTASGDQIVSTNANATVVQTISGLTAGVEYRFSICLCDRNDATSVEIAAISGATTVTATCALKPYWQLYQLTITVPSGQTTCQVRIGGNNSFGTGETLFAVFANFDLAENPVWYIPTTTAAILNYTLTTISRLLWDWNNRCILYSWATYTSSTNAPGILAILCQGSSMGFTMAESDKLADGAVHTILSFTNNLNCTFKNFYHCEDEKTLQTRGVPSYLGSVSNCAECKFLDFDFKTTGRSACRLMTITFGCKDLLFANWSIDDLRGYQELEISGSAGMPFISDNSNSGIVVQNMRLGDKYNMGVFGVNAKGTVLKGIQGGSGEHSTFPAQRLDSVSRAYTSVFDTSFFELYTGQNIGQLSLRFNETEKTVDRNVEYSGGCGFDSTGKFYIWGTDAVLTMTWPYRLLATTGFRNIAPMYYHTFWVSSVNDRRIQKPIVLKVEYQIDGGSWAELTAANLAGETITTDGFTFAIRMSVTGKVLEWDTKTNPFVLGETIRGTTGGTTGVVEEIDDQGTYGQIRLSNLTGTGLFIDNEYIVRDSDSQSRARCNIPTIYNDNMFPHAGSFIDALDIFTTVDQSIVYPVSQATLSLTGLKTGTEVTVVDKATREEIGGIESSGTEFSMTYDYYEDVEVEIYIQNLNYLWTSLETTLTANNQTIPVNQFRDRNYLNP